MEMQEINEKIEIIRAQAKALYENAKLADDDKTDEAYQLINWCLADIEAATLGLHNSNRHAYTELAKLKRDPNEIIGKDQFGYIDKYKQIRDAGGSPELIVKLAQMDGTVVSIQWKILNYLFDLPREEIHKLTEIT